MNSRSYSSIVLGLFLVGYGIAAVTNISVAPIVLAILAIIAGVLILFGR